MDFAIHHDFEAQFHLQEGMVKYIVLEENSEITCDGLLSLGL